VIVFILSFAVFGASGVARPFPSVKLTGVSPFLLTANVMIPVHSFFFLQWAGNPAKGNVDYCNGNGALSQGA